MRPADAPVYYRPICGCDVCRRRRAARHAKRRYYACEARIIVAEMTAAGATRQEIADVLDTTISGVQYVRRALADAGTPAVSGPRPSRFMRSAPEIVRRLRAGESYSQISRAVGFDARPYISRARSGRSRRPVDLDIAAAAGPTPPRSERMRQWHASRRGAGRSC